MSRQAAAELARGWIGTPYRHQASAKGAGTDCLGLIRGVWRELYGPEPAALPPYTPRWDEAGAEHLLQAARSFLIEAENAAPLCGQVLVFRMKKEGPAKHCGIALGPDLFLHAYDGRAVSTARYSPWWARRLAGIYDYPLAEDESA